MIFIDKELSNEDRKKARKHINKNKKLEKDKFYFVAKEGNKFYIFELKVDILEGVVL